MADGVEIIGLEELTRKLEAMGPALVREALKDSLEAAGSVLQEAQMAAAPVAADGDPHPVGQLRLDIRRVVTLKPFEGLGIVAIGPSQNSFYGSFHEFGTSHEAARPWMRPAFDTSAEAALTMFAKVLSAHIEAYGKGINIFDTTAGADSDAGQLAPNEGTR